MEMINNHLIQIREHLSEKSDFTQHRKIIILAGDFAWQKCTLSEMLLGHETDSLWVSDNAFDLLPSVSIKKAKNWLGNEKRVVVFDANKSFEPDSFAAISGIVVGGGFLFLLFPDYKQWKNTYSSNFGKRLLRSISSAPEIIIIKENNKKIDLHINNKVTNKPRKFKTPFLSIEQQYAVEKISELLLNEKNHTVVLKSDRGRGKSAALGLVIVRLMQAGIKNIAITAPRLRATDIVFKHIIECFPNATLEKGKIKTNESNVQFYSPDDLIESNITADILFVDEAAAIPVSILTVFLSQFSQCVFSTTVHGYEGTGRGFDLCFHNILTEKKPNWTKIHMQHPIRWAENDPLEQWVFDLFCLDAEIANVSNIKSIIDIQLEHQILTKKQLIENSELLSQVFSLLVLAHYRTKPSDLKKLLDDDDLSVYVTLNNKKVIAVALVIYEGDFSSTLSRLVYQGERRPAGHLLAQALTYHCGVEYAATLNYARIMRIAVHPVLQQQGVGSELLEFIINYEKNNGQDAIGASFSMNERLLTFWQKLNFNVVRIGFTREQTSGEHAAIMLQPLTSMGGKISQEAIERFSGNAPYLFEDVLKDIPSAIQNKLNINKTTTNILSLLDEKDLRSFKEYSRNYELSIGALNKFFSEKQELLKKDKNYDVLEQKIINKESWKEIALKLNFNGKNEARITFKKTISYFL